MRENREHNHQILDAICAEYIADTNKLLSKTSAIELMEWHYEKIKKEKEYASN